MTSNVYKKNGYKDREHYLQCLAKDIGIDEDAVFTAASMLGPSEDFDLLVICLVACTLDAPKPKDGH